MTSVKEYLSLYENLGFTVIPLRFKEKSPRLEWKEYQIRKPTPEELNEWFVKEETNVGIVCGQTSNNLVVVDFDDPEVYQRFFDPAEIEKSTLVVRTSRGFQVYLLSKEPVRSAKIPELHMEIRSNGNYVVAPPSIHPSGHQYAFLSPEVKSVVLISDLERELWERIEDLGVRKRVFVDPTWRTGRAGTYKGSTPPCIEELLKGVGLGARHDAAIRLFGYFINFRGEKPKATLEKMKKWNEKNTPPLDEEELQGIFGDVAKGPYCYGCSDSVFRCYCDQENCEVGRNKVSADAIAKAQELTKDPEAFLRFLQETLEFHLTGEWKNRIFLFLIGCGASVRTSLIRICGPNSVGKNMLCGWLEDVFGSDRVIPLSSASAPYLKRKVMQGLDTRGKIFILLEERGEQQGALKYQFEQIYSEDKIVIGMNVRNQESGEWEPVEVVLQGPLCFITTSTDIEVSLHASSRQWEIYPDDSPAQTERISGWSDWRELRSQEDLKQEARQTEILKAHVGLLQAHQDYRIPFIRKINFKARTIEDRRRKNDFVGLMRYASHVFQHCLPIDTNTDTVFSMPFIFHFVLMIADEIIYTARGGLNNAESKVLRFIENHPEIYTLDTEGRYVKARPEGTEVKAEGFTKRSLLEHPAFVAESERMSERTLHRALQGLAAKSKLAVLKSVKGGATGIVYGRLLSSSLSSSEDAKSSLLPEMTAVSDEYLNLTTRHVLCVKPGDPNPVQERLESVIGSVKLSSYKIRQESVLFQPQWSGIERIGLALSLDRLRQVLSMLARKKGEDA